MSKEYSAIEIAKAIIRKCKKHDWNINITKLQKLLYIVYGIYLSENSQVLFDEEPLCLPFGPVFNSVLQLYKQGKLDLREEYPPINDENIQETIERVVRGFGQYGAKTLSEWSHREGSTWDRAHRESDIWGNFIDKDYIKEEFDKFIKSLQNAQKG
ncbi:Uncharacterized phage-associated protein [Brevinema andersonii]|uniref:Uncharacterized phage-associated protein n=1 Tax=Brevinema andersonii TaxID=34097 RepID=A0A1I1EMW6_BREAD|nr:type II toxin-antitoxin system antitoxin SocA domain-containing protein [Brevinema andersonii]SFB88367.1 Uncharacterized phage-associated protein [Brevinema andersonii]